MLRQIASVMLALGVVLASASVGTSAYADQKKDDAPKNLSSSPREKIYDLKDGTHVHIMTMSNGRYLVSITHRNGRHEAFIMNPRTGLVTPAARGNVYWGTARLLVKDAAILAGAKPLIREMAKPAVNTSGGAASSANKPATAPALAPAVTAARPSTPAVSTTVSTTVGRPVVTTRSAPALLPPATAVRPSAPAVSTVVHTTVGPPRISMGPAMAVRAPIITPAIRR